MLSQQVVLEDVLATEDRLEEEQGRGRARPDNAAADADAEADEGSKADKSDSDAEADQADRWARGRDALRASGRRGLLQARRAS